MKPIAQLVLSLFPGIGILDRAFEEEGFCIVRGPDLLWSGDIKRFHPPLGRFDGIVGGTPCQCFTSLIALIKARGGTIAENLIPEFERVVSQAQPRWFVMENVKQAPLPQVRGYHVDPTLLQNRWLGEKQSRMHRFSFGTRDGRRLHYETVALEVAEWESRVIRRTVCAGHGGKGEKRRKYTAERTVEQMAELQGLGSDFFRHSPFRRESQRQMLANAVPLPMGRALARAVRDAIEKRDVTPSDRMPTAMAHEGAHGSRQVSIFGIDRWWRQYLDDAEFRYREEVIGHAAELLYFANGERDRNRKSQVMLSTARRLLAPFYQYGGKFSHKQAVHDLTHAAHRMSK